MNKYPRVLLASAVMASLVLGTTVLAKDNESKGNKEIRGQIQSIKNSIKDLRHDIKDQRKDNEDEHKNENQNKDRNQRVLRFWQQINTQLGTMVFQEANIARNASKSLDQLSRRGVDVSAARTKLAAANVLVKDAQDTYKTNTDKINAILKNVLTAAVSPVASVSSTANLTLALSQINDLIRQTLDKIRLAHSALDDVSWTIKLSSWPTQTPTPSVSVSPSPTPTPTH